MLKNTKYCRDKLEKIKKWRSIPLTWIGKFNIKMSIPPSKCINPMQLQPKPQRDLWRN